jgi:hypothetical protein
MMRREMKLLLLIELNVLRVEVEQLREIKQFLSASINQIRESRGQWRGEAERLRALTEPAREGYTGFFPPRYNVCTLASALRFLLLSVGVPPLIASRYRVSADFPHNVSFPREQLT